jgi:hypothetical protein
MNRTQLLQLSADLDRVIELRSFDDEDDRKKGSILGTAAKVGAIAAPTAYLAGQSGYSAASGIPVRELMREDWEGIKKTGRKTASGIGAAKTAAGRVYNPEGAATGLKNFFNRANRANLARIGRSAKAAFTHTYSAKTENLLTLSAELDEVINFDLMGMVKKYGPAVGKSALKWGGIGAAGGAVAGGVSGALSEDPNQSALGGALGGAAAGGLLGAAGGAGMRGMKISSAINKAAGMRLARSKSAAARTTSALRDPNTSVADALTNKRKAIYENGMNTPRGMKNPTVFSSRLQSLVQLSAELDGVMEFGQAFNKWDRDMGRAIKQNWDDEDPRLDKYDRALGRGSYRGAGMAVGAGAGGIPLAVAIAKKKLPLGSTLGKAALIPAGYIAGSAVGSRIDRK